MQKNIYLHGFNLIKGLGVQTFKDLITFFDQDYIRAWNELEKSPLPTKIVEQKNTINLVEEEKYLNSCGISLLDPRSNLAPNLLKQMPDIPIVLYYRGTLPNPTRPLITIVGTRKISNYGKSILNYLVTPLVSSGIGVISGLAYGIDGYAHKQALLNNGYTAAVLGSGINIITPPTHEYLAKNIIKNHGAVISEMPPDMPAYKGSFPRRNRILAAMSKVTLIVEAAEKSGSLITAHYALDYNREVATIPGSIFSQTSQGCHQLITQGAKVITKPEDLLEVYQNITGEIRSAEIKLSKQETNVLAQLNKEAKKLEDILVNLSYSSAETLAILTTLELKGLVNHFPGFGYRLI